MFLVVFLQLIEHSVGGEEAEGELFAIGYAPFIRQLSYHPLMVLLGYACLEHVAYVPQHGHERQLLVVCEKVTSIHWSVTQ